MVATGGEQDAPSQLLEARAAMAGLLLSEQTVDALLALLVSLAKGAMAGVDEASVSLVRRDRFETTPATSAEVRAADGVQYQFGKGPCIEATQQAETINIGLADSRPRWPEFTDAALCTGFQGVLSTPLAVRERTLGSLNLYSRTEESFAPAEEQAAQAFADQASVVLTNATALATSAMVNDQLREALVTRDVIGQAKGILMARQGCSADEAFDVLRRASQRANRTLADMAEELVEAIHCSGR